MIKNLKSGSDGDVSVWFDDDIDAESEKNYGKLGDCVQVFGKKQAKFVLQEQICR